jgi:hypothetical protein
MVFSEHFMCKATSILEELIEVAVWIFLDTGNSYCMIY